MKTMLLTLAALAMTGAAPALANEVLEPEPVTQFAGGGGGSFGTDWTGFSVGAQISYGDVDTDNPDLDGDDVLYGFRAYYDYDFGQFVIGAGLQYDFTDIGLDGVADVDEVFRAGVRGGVDLNSNWLYVTGGYAFADTDAGTVDVGSSDGFFVGAGYEVYVTEMITVGSEVLYHEFSDFDVDGLDAEVVTISLSVNYRF